jgi:hypothetical protein
MFGRLNRSFAEHITSAGHLAMLSMALASGTRSGWLIALGLIALTSFAFWALNFRRTRVVSDTPTSRIASAPQGYVELYGTGLPFGDQPLRAPLSGRACLWYRYLIEERRSREWATIERGLSHDSFVLDDGSGIAVIDPERAEVFTSHRRRWTDGNRRYHEWLLLPREAIYALGDFATIGGASAQLDAQADVSALLAEWKANQPALHERFDLNRDGQIDLAEWELARSAARREIAKRHQELRSQPGVHVLHHPADARRPFLLADAHPERVASRYALWTRLQLAIAVLAGGSALYLAALLPPL